MRCGLRWWGWQERRPRRAWHAEAGDTRGVVGALLSDMQACLSHGPLAVRPVVAGQSPHLRPPASGDWSGDSVSPRVAWSPLAPQAGRTIIDTITDTPRAQC